MQDVILLIGADGFIGSCLERGLRLDGSEVIGTGKLHISDDFSYIESLTYGDLIRIVKEKNVTGIYYVNYKTREDQFSEEEIHEISKELSIPIINIYTVETYDVR